MDAEKAFDQVDWMFMKQVFMKMGFGINVIVDQPYLLRAESKVDLS